MFFEFLVPPPTFDPPRGTRDESNSRFAVRDPRSRDPRADRDPRVERGISRDLDSSQRGAPPSIPPELAGADPARRQLLMQVYRRSFLFGENLIEAITYFLFAGLAT